MTESLRERLAALADRYETAEFLEGDPSSFMHRAEGTREKEVAAFVAASLAFGNRKQILAHVEKILAECGNSLCDWILSGGHEKFFPDDGKSFYRTYSNRSMLLLFCRIREILTESETLGEFFRKKWLESKQSGEKIFLHQLIMREFPDGCTPIPHSADSAAKKINMFLRWMVRRNSPVDLGLWTWHSPADLLIPLDTHVMQEATRLGLLGRTAGGRPRTASLKTAVELTWRLREAFPGDPCRGDFALFGLGVDATGK